MHPSLPACPPGRYGKGCVPCKCNHHSSCRPLDGTCYCLAGWTSPDCSQRTYVGACVSAQEPAGRSGMGRDGRLGMREACSPAAGPCLDSVTSLNKSSRDITYRLGLFWNKPFPGLLLGKWGKSGSFAGTGEVISWVCTHALFCLVQFIFNLHTAFSPHT